MRGTPGIGNISGRGVLICILWGRIDVAETTENAEVKNTSYLMGRNASRKAGTRLLKGLGLTRPNKGGTYPAIPTPSEEFPPERVLVSGKRIKMPEAMIRCAL